MTTLAPTPSLDTATVEDLTRTNVVAAVVPRVDLLPTAIRERKRTRRAKRSAVVVGAAALVGVAAMYAIAMLDANSAQEELDAVISRGSILAAQQAKYAEVPRVFNAAESAQRQLSTAMGSEVRWSEVLSDISTYLPPGVGLTSINASLVQGAAQLPVAAGATPVPGAPGTAVNGAAPIGTISYEGDAKVLGSVATWLDRVAAQRGTLANAYVTKSSRGSAATSPDVVAFTTSADLTTGALSRRFPAPVASAVTAPALSPGGAK